MSDEDPRRSSPAALRNRDPILEALRPRLPAAGLLLEIASGSGEHAVHLAAALGPAIAVQPSDPDPGARASIDAWGRELRLDNLRPALALDAAAWPWPIARAEAVLCVNMVHIAPWEATLGLLCGAAAVLPAGAPLVLYGPFRRAGVPTAPSNEAFDADLRARDPRWGLRRLETVAEAAAEAGFGPPEVIAMPANNLTVVLRRRAPGP
jgi:hypothetical protein